MVAKIALKAATYAIDKPYDYMVPAELSPLLEPGMRVIVPFGAGNRHTEGIVLALEETGPVSVPLKPILTVLDERPVLDREGLKLALWMRERWFCTVYDAARAMLLKRGCIMPSRINGSWPKGWTGSGPTGPPVGRSTPGRWWSCSLAAAAAPMWPPFGKPLAQKTPTRR